MSANMGVGDLWDYAHGDLVKMAFKKNIHRPVFIPFATLSLFWIVTEQQVPPGPVVHVSVAEIQITLAELK